jgi:hypothetical protein
MSRLLSQAELRSLQLDLEGLKDPTLLTTSRRVVLPRGAASPIDRKWIRKWTWDEFVKNIEPSYFTRDAWDPIVEAAVHSWLEAPEEKLPAWVTKSMLWHLAGYGAGVRQTGAENFSYAASGTTTVPIPGYVNWFRAWVWGAGGASGNGNSGTGNGGQGGCGAFVTALFNVIPLSSYDMEVGGGGQVSGTASRGGGGAGKTVITRNSDASERLIAGGGGGGGGASAASGTNHGGPGGIGGAQDGTPASQSGISAQGGSTTAGGLAPGTTASITNGTNGNASGGGDGGNQDGGTGSGGAGGFNGGGNGGGAGVGGGGGGHGKFGGGGGGGRPPASNTSGGGLGGGGSSECLESEITYMAGAGDDAPNTGDSHYNGTAGQGGATSTTTAANVGADGLIAIVY